MTKATPQVRPLGDFFLLFTGPGIWFAHFVVMYGAEALICTGSTGSSGRQMVWVTVAATGFALAAITTFIARLRRHIPAGETGHDESRFRRVVSIVLAILSMLGVLWVALPAALLSACTPAG